MKKLCHIHIASIKPAIVIAGIVTNSSYVQYERLLRATSAPLKRVFSYTGAWSWRTNLCHSCK